MFTDMNDMSAEGARQAAGACTVLVRLPRAATLCPAASSADTAHACHGQCAAAH